MVDQSTSLTTMNVTLIEDEADAAVINKDEQVTLDMDENGYESDRGASITSNEDVARAALEVEADVFTSFIERQRVEVMFELRNLRMGERPVTGQRNRERIQAFLSRVQEQQQQGQQRLPRTPSARPAVPSAHIADIDALASRRCVSAALGSAGFRQDLENAVRRSIETRSTTTPQQISQAPLIPQNFIAINREQQNAPTVPSDIETVIREQERPQRTQTPRDESFNVQRQENELQAWQTITQLQREIIVLEISDLVHRQLVSSALESDFRSHLERNILARWEQGAPPQQGPAIVAPRAQLMPAPIRPATNTRTTTVCADELSTRLDAMQHMLQLMFSMQMDMQRSLRQEVSSALASNSSDVMISASQPANSGHCTVCLTAIADTVLYRCGHLCVCYMCGLNLRQATSATRVKCPICRAPVDDILRVYRSSPDGE